MYSRASDIAPVLFSVKTNTVPVELLSSYSESNQDNYLPISNLTGDVYQALGQSFTGDGGLLHSIKFYIKRNSVPTGNLYANIYAHTGTYGVSGKPTGSALATSSAIDVSTVDTSVALVTFTFWNTNKITLTNGTKYVAVIDGSGVIDTEGFGSRRIDVGVDESSPTYSGNQSMLFEGSWSGVASTDLCFYVYREGISSEIMNVYGSVQKADFFGNTRLWGRHVLYNTHELYLGATSSGPSPMMGSVEDITP